MKDSFTVFPLSIIRTKHPNIMKKRVFYLLILSSPVWLGNSILFAQHAEEILSKAIQYHDPQGNWDNFSGKMLHITVFGSGYVVHETIELDRTKDYYCSTAKQEFGTVVRGLDGGEPFFTVNGQAPESEEIINNWSLNKEGVKMFKQQHSCHFGLLMQLKEAGMVLSEQVNKAEFDGRNCYTLTFNGEADQVIDPFYQGERVLYIDAQTYSLRGCHMKHPQFSPATYYFSREIEIDGIKVPHTRVFVREHDGYRFTSTNMTLEP
jgi:hypothetical protein